MDFVKTMRIVYNFSLKGLVNRIKFFPLKAILSGLIIIAVVMFPVFIFNANIKPEIPIKYINIIFSLYFSSLFFKFLKEKEFTKTSNKLICLLGLVPGEINKLYDIYTIDLIIRTFFSYAIMYTIIFLYAEAGIFNYILGILLVFIMCSILVVLNAMSIFISKIKNKTLKVLWFLLGLFFIFISLAYLFPDIVYSIGISEYLPDNIFASTANLLLGMDMMHNIHLYISCLIELFFLLVISCFFYFIVKTKSQLEPYEFYVKSQKAGMKTYAKRFLHIKRGLFILPSKMKVLAGKELLQIWDEKIPLITAIIMPTLVTVIMVVMSKTLARDIIIMGFIISISYESFLVSVVSLPREARTIWILKTTCSNWKLIIFSKYAGCYIASFLGSILFFVLYSTLSKIVLGVAISEFMQPLVWSFFTTIPGSIGFGLLIGSLLPFDVIEKNKEIDYKFNGIEGAILLVLVFFMGLPSTVAGGFFNEIDNIYIKLLFIIYIIVIIFLSYVSSKGKLIKIT